MKKTGLFKIIMFILLGTIVFTWIFSAGYFTNGEMADLGMYNVGFFDYFQLLFGSFQFSYFIQIFILLISIGAFYGVLEKTGKYRAWIERIANNFGGAELVFLYSIAFAIAAITSIFDYGFTLFIFIPLIISIILAMGYDKITACVATFGAMLVGTIGSTLGYNTSGAISTALSASASVGLYFKLALFVLALTVLFIYLYKAKPNKKDKKNLDEDLFIGEKLSNKYSVVSIIIVFSALFVLLVLGCTNWTGTFNVNVFSDFNTKISETTIKLPYFHITTDGIDKGTEEIAIFSKLLGNATALGEWYYAEMSIMCLLSALVIGACFRMKFAERFEYMGQGIKKMLRPASLVMLIYTVIYFAGNTMFFPVIGSYILGITSKFNIFFSTIVMALGSALHVDMLYVVNYVVPQIASKDVNSTVIALLSQGIYGVTMFVAPTSAFLALGLSYLGISYKEWIKKTWKLILSLLAVVIAVIIAAMLIV